MGGRVGLKGTDGESIYRKAKTLGARPEAQARALDALKVIGLEVPALELLTCAGPMGEIVAQNSGVSCNIIEGVPADLRETNAADTRRATMEMCRSGVDLLLFAGGDGTARDISDTLASTVGSSDPMPVLGIPAGVKMHSGVFALTPRRAGEIVVRFLNSESEAPEVADAEVMDIDERRPFAPEGLQHRYTATSRLRWIQPAFNPQNPGLSRTTVKRQMILQGKSSKG